MASPAPSALSATHSVSPPDQTPVAAALPAASASMSCFTVHSKSTVLGEGPEGPPPPPVGPGPLGPGPGPGAGRAVTVMVTSTVARPPLPSSASTMTVYVSFAAMSKVTPSPTVIWPLCRPMSKKCASLPKRLYVSVSFSSTSVAVTGAPTGSPSPVLAETERSAVADGNSGPSFTGRTVTETVASLRVRLPSEAV